METQTEQTLNKNSLFYEYDKIIKKVNKINNFEEEFLKLNEGLRINIVLSWFGLFPLFKEMIKEQKGEEHFKEVLIKLKYKGNIN